MTFSTRVKREAWSQVCSEIGAEFVPAKPWRSDKVQLLAGDWIVTLDTDSLLGEGSGTAYTRLRAPFVNPRRFAFILTRRSLLAEFTLGADRAVRVDSFDFHRR